MVSPYHLRVMPRPAVCKTVVDPRAGSRQVERYHHHPRLLQPGAIAQPRRATACRAEGRGSNARLRRHFPRARGRKQSVRLGTGRHPAQYRGARPCFWPSDGTTQPAALRTRRPQGCAGENPVTAILRSRSLIQERDSSNVEDAGVTPAGSARDHFFISDPP